MKELSKSYSPKAIEDTIYKMWEDSGFFNPDNLSGEPFSVMMPPPNVTGVLHLGHALENTIMDAKVRYERMSGKKVLLIPGTDHAAVATQAKVENILIERGIKDPRKELGREKLLEEIRTYAEKSKKTIISQVRKMGTSCDWSRLAYTFDDTRSTAVNIVFKKMFDDGLIYRGYRVINWSVKGQSTCSDDELEYIERPAKLYTFKYSKDFPITIATTRPETKLGDTAVAVHPDDTRYKKYIGQIFTVDVGAEKPLSIKVIASVDVDPTFGTGALGVTPAHSAVDFDMYEKQKTANDPIDLIQVIDAHGMMAPAAGTNYAGLSVIDAREKFVTQLKENGLLVKEEDTIQNVGTSDRFKDVVEALPMTQWFIDVNKKIPGKDKTLKELMMDSVTIGLHGNTEEKIIITPERFLKNYSNWIENLRDWCISRQVWWGHRIPVWYKNKSKVKNQKSKVEEMYVGTQPPKGKGWVQDPDTLDTWFSSGLWTFSTLGWPEETVDFKTFHPSSWMQMGHEILFFWMARMILMSTYTLDQIPFKDVYIHGILRDEKGNKFSKSAGNNIDPLEVIEQYGTDALRLSLLFGIAPGNDSKYYEEKVVGARNFISKLWNISRFILQKTSDTDLSANDLLPHDLTVFDKMILEKMRDLTNDVARDMDAYRFAQAVEKLHNFTWLELADWYIEVTKFENNVNTKNMILRMILEDILALWHPFIPFVTEEIWQHMQKKRLLLISPLPAKDKYESLVGTNDTGSQQSNLIKELITTIRTMTKEQNITAKDLHILIDDTQRTSGPKNLVSTHENIVKKLRTGVNNITLIASHDNVPDNAVSATTLHGITIHIPLDGLIDIATEKKKKEAELTEVCAYIATLEKKLLDEQFVKNAPKKIVESEKEKLQTAQSRKESIMSQITNLQ
ncbi:MAG: valine--tRNA ligase [Parcubacteria group bacterium]